MRQQQSKGQNTQDRGPDDVLAAEPIAQGSAGHAAHCRRGQEHEQQQLGSAHRNVKVIDEVEGVIAGDAREVDVLREHQRQQHRDGEDDVTARGTRCLRSRRARQARDAVRLVPVSDIDEHHDAEQCRDGEPRHARLAARQHHEGREQRPRRGTEVAADLEHRLRQAVLAAGGHACHARGFGMEHRRAGADEGGREQQQRIAVGKGEQHEPHQREPHAGGE